MNSTLKKQSLISALKKAVLRKFTTFIEKRLRLSPSYSKVAGLSLQIYY